MITAEAAKSIADNCLINREDKILEDIERRIKTAASAGQYYLNYRGRLSNRVVETLCNAGYVVEVGTGIDNYTWVYWSEKEDVEM